MTFEVLFLPEIPGGDENFSFGVKVFFDLF